MMATHRSHIVAISAYIVAMCCPHRYDDSSSFVMMATHRSHIVAISAHIAAIPRTSQRCAAHIVRCGPLIRNADVHIATMWIHHS